MYLIKSPATRLLSVGSLVAAACTLALPHDLQAGPYREGEFIDIAGTVTDSDGMPIPDVKVVLHAERRVFRIGALGRTTRDTVRNVTTTDPGGQFEFRWRWVDYYNRFEIQAGMPTRSSAGESFEILANLDLSDRIRKGSPVVASLVIDDTLFVESLKEFLASVDRADEKRIYDEMGIPDRVQHAEGTGDDEVTWWYFRSGKAYRFEAGQLQQVIHFDPITPFGS